MDLGLQKKGVWDSNPDGSRIGIQMDPCLQRSWLWDCNADGPRTATLLGQRLTPKVAAHGGLGLQQKWAWDWILEELRTATQMEPGLQPKQIWDYNTDGSGIATEMGLG